MATKEKMTPEQRAWCKARDTLARRCALAREARWAADPDRYIVLPELEHGYSPFIPSVGLVWYIYKPARQVMDAHGRMPSRSVMETGHGMGRTALSFSDEAEAQDLCDALNLARERRERHETPALLDLQKEAEELFRDCSGSF